MNGEKSTLLEYIDSFGKTTGALVSAFNPPKPAPASPAPQAQSRMNWTPYAVAAGALVLIVLVFAMLSGRKG